MLGWWRRASLRARLILIGSAGVTAGLVIGGLILVQTLSYALLRNLDQSATQTAKETATLIQAGRLPDPIPAGGDAAVVQVLDQDGGIVAVSSGGDRLVPLLPADQLRNAHSGSRYMVTGDRAGLDDPVRVVVQTAKASSGPQTVLVAVSAHSLEESVGIVRKILLVAFPLLVVVLAIVAWRVVGWTLRPVEQLRRGAAEITGSRSDGRLPVPSGNDEVHRLAVTLNDMLARLEAARARQRAFVADAAHELRSPLASMRTQTEVAARLGTQADWDETAGGLLADLDRLQRLTDDLLLLARADDAAAQAMVKQPIDLAEVVREVAARYADARVAVSANAGTSLWVLGARDGLHRMIANLLDNACRHAATKVSVVVTADGAAMGSAALLTVTDDGSGIPEADRERVFERFTRLDDARARNDGGNGLGLAIVREVARIHGGTVWLEDAAPGVRAVVRLPLREPDPGRGATS
ncbi:sensor histidine kinase [Flindersiella endophytica]